MTWGNPPPIVPTIARPGKVRKVYTEIKGIPIKEYRKMIAYKWNEKNKERATENRKAYKLKNDEKIKAQNKKYYENNKHKKQAQVEKKRLENPELVLAKYRAKTKARRVKNQEYQNNRIKTDPQFKIARNLRIRLRQALKNNQKNGSAIDLLGCSIVEFKLYLERLFTEGMSWENYGQGWHIDHIKPLSKFDLENIDNLKVLCHFTNLQPLWAKDNITKKAKMNDVE